MIRRILVIIAGALALTGPSAFGQLDQVVIDLTGVRLKHRLDQYRDSAPDRIRAGFGYSYHIEGMVQGQGGLLGTLFPDPTDLAEVLDSFQDGASEMLDGTLYNASGAHPFTMLDQRFNGVVNLFGIDVTYDMTLTARVLDDGVVAFSITNVVLSPEVLVGSAIFTSGSVTVTRVPAITGDLNWDGAVNALDIEAFILALFDPAGYTDLYGYEPVYAGDCNRDGAMNASDIEPFLAILFG